MTDHAPPRVGAPIALVPSGASATLHVLHVRPLPRVASGSRGDAALVVRVVAGRPGERQPEACRALSRQVSGAIRRLADEWPGDQRLAALVDRGAEVTLPSGATSHDDQDFAPLGLATCVAVLARAGVVPPDAVDRIGLVGAVTAEGKIEVVPGVPGAVRAARRHGLAGVVVPGQAYTVVAAVLEAYPAQAYPADTVEGLVALLRGHRLPPPILPLPTVDVVDVSRDGAAWTDLADVSADHPVRPAVELAAAGRHGVVLRGVGYPHFGEARTVDRVAALLAGVLPPLTPRERADVICVRAQLPQYATTPTWAHPVHLLELSDGPARLSGDWARGEPGIAQLAQHGVLVVPHVGARRSSQVDHLTRSLVALHADRASCPILVVTVAACACGRHAWQVCGCAPRVAQAHRARADQACDRLRRAGLVDLTVDVGASLVGDRRGGESTAEVRARVTRADRARRVRTTVTRVPTGGQPMTPVTRVARTIADLRGLADVDAACLAEARQWARG